MHSTSPDAGAEAVLQQAYALARASAGQGLSLVALHIGAEAAGIAVGIGPQPDLLKLLPLGAARTAREQFRCTPPTPLALENAIQVVEDAVMPLRTLIPREALLFSTDAGVREIAALSGVTPDETALSLEAMERCFNRLAAVVEGSSFAQQGLPESNSLAATLLILREFMHHLQFAHVRLLHAH
jgi:exopolyphosphatase/pppGpp-phosphohydrolase